MIGTKMKTNYDMSNKACVKMLTEIWYGQTNTLG